MCTRTNPILEPLVLVKPEPTFMALWAKSRSEDPGEQGYHPLVYHLFDVAAVAEALWTSVLTAHERRAVGERLGLDESDAKRWVAFLAGVHDIGKASPAFQQKDPDAKDRLRGAGWPVGQVAGAAPHGMVSAETLREVFADWGMDSAVADTLAVAVGGHHGIIPSDADIDAMSTEAAGKRPWTSARKSLVGLLASILEVPVTRLPVVDDAAALWLAGFISVADWIGSNQRVFEFAARSQGQAPNFDTEYFRRSRALARQALQRFGWLAQPIQTPGTRSFQEMFGYSPNPVQKAVMSLEERLDAPGLVVIEAPMGEGKTEAGLWLADRWAARLGQRGFYVALPTQATSDQMFDRVASFLRAHFPADTVNLQLLHGHAALSAAFGELKQEGYRVFQPTGIGVDDRSVSRPAVAAAEWFTYRKRGLLAPFGVGTVDQILLAALQTRHVFVRLFGLAHKTVIIDEVHAYDAYMSRLLDRLLEWLAALGASVVLLSATLPDARRKELCEAYLKGGTVDEASGVPEARYPRVTAVGDSHSPRAMEIPTSAEARRSLKLVWVSPLLSDGFPLAGSLQGQLRNGGTAVVICNTVRRAQEVYLALKPFFPDTADDGMPELDLLHARFLWKDRAERERRVLRRFGKSETQADSYPVQRPSRAVLVATQIVEQSLDLDFDVMVSDLAPIDLLLQRSGRLHRHRRPDRPIEQPEFWIAEPEQVTGGVPDFDPGSEKVYFPHILLRSWLVLRDRKCVQIPDQVESLIEAVYGTGERPADESLQLIWDETREAMGLAQQEEAHEAGNRIIRPPGTTDYLSQIVATAREEEAPELHPALQAATRLTEPNVSVIMLETADGVLQLDGRPYDPEKVATLRQTERLLLRSVTLSDRRVLWRLIREEVPSGWQQSPLLRQARLVELSSDGGKEIHGHLLRLDPELGVRID